MYGRVLVEGLPTFLGADEQLGAEDGSVIRTCCHGAGERGETQAALDGEIVLELNGAVSKKLKIPPQTYILGREPGPEMFHIDVDNFPAQ